MPEVCPLRGRRRLSPGCERERERRAPGASRQTTQSVAGEGLAPDASRGQEERALLTWPADLAETSDLAWDALSARCSDTDARRFLCRFGSAVAWLQEREDGRLATVPLDRRRMVRLLARCGRWLRVSENGASPIPPPREVADGLLVDPDPPLPRLERIVEVPILAPDGSVHEAPGYDPASRCFYSPASGLAMPKVADAPGREDVDRAVELLYKLVRDFPFPAPSRAPANVPMRSRCCCCRSCAH